MAKDDFDDLSAEGVRPRKSRLTLRLTLLCLLGFSAAAGAGYLWWTQRAEHRAATAELDKLRFSGGNCTRELDELTGKVATLGEQVTACQAAKQGSEASVTTMAANLEATRGELDDLRKQRAESEKRLAAFKSLTDQFQKMIDAGEIEVKVRDGSMLVAMPAEVLFPSGSAELSEPGKLAVLQVGAILKGLPERRFLVVGHTDNLPLKGSTYSSNWQLSTARSVTVTEYLVSAGFNPKNLIAAGHGEHDPVANNKSPDGRKRNRRIEIRLLPNIDELPAMPTEAAEGAKGAEATKSSGQ